MQENQSLAGEWSELDSEEKKAWFFSQPRADAEKFFSALSTYEQFELIEALPPAELGPWLQSLALDDAADLIQLFPAAEREALLALLDEEAKKEVSGLLAYDEDDAGGLMNPRFLRLAPEMTTDEAIHHLRGQARTSLESIYYAYVLDAGGKLLGVVSFRDLLLAAPTQKIGEIMKTPVAAPADMDQEELFQLFAEHGFLALPVVDSDFRMKGVVTQDDIAEVMEEEATEDMQKAAGMEALDAPYWSVSFLEMLKKRAGWLALLFVGESFTATVMGYYEQELARAVVLALFIPLIISSGGNSGSQASTLIIRALALREVRLGDWWRVLKRELASGLALGSVLGLMGLARVVVWQQWNPVYGEHYLLIGITVALSLVGIVLWGTVTGAMLPFLLRKAGLDPASASAPFVATLVDVTGLAIYFSAASLILSGALL